MKWNNNSGWYTEDGVKTAWSKKTGNATEINLILYDLLKKSGLKVFPMFVGSRDNDEGPISPYYSNVYQISKTIAFITTADSARYYVLDATNKYNIYNEVPADLLNTYAIKIIPGERSAVKGRMLLLKNDVPAKHLVSITAEITPDSKVIGTTIMNNYSYSRADYNRQYDKLGESTYIDVLRNGDNQLKITDLSFENMAVDTLPLVQKFNFNLSLSAAGDNYVYFNPNLFTPLRVNPFLSNERFSDIDFGNCNVYSINGIYKLPAGYKVDVLPQNALLNMYDKSIIFRRIINEDKEDGRLTVSYSITYKRAIYGVSEYKSLWEFYKKMFDMINEPIVLKKVQ